MKAPAEFPFDEYFVYPPRFVPGEGRYYVTLTHQVTGAQTITSLARYRMSVKLGRRLNSDEHVDHEDGDRSNDHIDNLQILSPQANNLKRVQERGLTATMTQVKCPQCSKMFEMKTAQYNYKLSVGTQPCCSRSCATAHAHPNMSHMADQIKALRAQGKSVYAISDELGIARNTVMKYW